MSEPNAVREVRDLLYRKPYTVVELVNELWYRPGTIARALAQLQPEQVVLKRPAGHGNHPRAYWLAQGDPPLDGSARDGRVSARGAGAGSSKASVPQGRIG